MKTHFEHLLESFPKILYGSVLDVGAGRGSFLIDAVSHGVDTEGIEFKQDNIKIALQKARALNLEIKLKQGRGEDFPYEDNQFDFVNLCEVIEHVEYPQKVLSEIYRVFKLRGEVYMSVPNRFGFKDQHFHMYFINWMPRAWSEKIILWFNKQKNYDGGSGFQRLSEMHYSTYREMDKMVSSIGFNAFDLREQKLMEKIPNFLKFIFIPIYRFLRLFIFNAFHFKLVK